MGPTPDEKKHDAEAKAADPYGNYRESMDEMYSKLAGSIEEPKAKIKAEMEASGELEKIADAPQPTISEKGVSVEAQKAIDEMSKAANSLQYRKEDGEPMDILPDKLEALPKLSGTFEDLPDDVKVWLKAQLEELGPETILHHLAIQMVTNQRLADRIRAIDALVHTGNRRERRARAKQIAKKGIDLMSGM